MLEHREAWLRLVAEEAIEPDLPICDAHHHLWDGPGARGRYLVNEYLRDCQGGHKVIKTVFLECGTMYRKEGAAEMQSVGETEFVQALTAATNTKGSDIPYIAAGIVGLADLTLGSRLRPVLEAHIAAGKGRLRGIRQSCTWDGDPRIISMAKSKGMMLDRRFREGFALLEAYGLSFDAWQYHTQLTELADLARAFPATRIIVNHTGGPLGVGLYAGKRDEVFQRWRRGMSDLASCPNVVVKLGGLGMERSGFGWHERQKPPTSSELAQALRPYLEFCIEVFGAGRCMFESNFPVDKVSYSYTVLWNAFKRIAEHCSSSERAALLHDTAIRVYRLEG